MAQTRFTLVVAPDGGAILTTPHQLDMAMAQVLRAAFNEWLRDRAPLIIADCEVVQIKTIEPSIEPVVGAPSPAEVRHERLDEGGR